MTPSSPDNHLSCCTGRMVFFCCTNLHFPCTQIHTRFPFPLLDHYHALGMHIIIYWRKGIFVSFFSRENGDTHPRFQNMKRRKKEKKKILKYIEDDDNAFMPRLPISPLFFSAVFHLFYYGTVRAWVPFLKWKKEGRNFEGKRRKKPAVKF